MFCLPKFLSHHKTTLICCLSFLINLTSSASLCFSCYSYGKRKMTETENLIIVVNILATILLKNLTLSIVLNPEIFEKEKEEKREEIFWREGKRRKENMSSLFFFLAHLNFFFFRKKRGKNKSWNGQKSCILMKWWK